MAQMLRYETLMLAIPAITNDEASKIETQFAKTVKDAKGAMISFDRWGKYRLAYPIKDNDYGVYYLARFEVPSESKNDLLKEIKSLFTIKYNDLVMRDLTSVLDAKASLDYIKPESLEDTPKDVDSFLRENKMEGLLGKGKKAAAQEVDIEIEEDEEDSE